jgi:hypothetical protein
MSTRPNPKHVDQAAMRVAKAIVASIPGEAEWDAAPEPAFAAKITAAYSPAMNAFSALTEAARNANQSNLTFLWALAAECTDVLQKTRGA